MSEKGRNQTPEKMQSINPYTEEVVEEFTLMTKSELDEAVKECRAAFHAWKRVTVDDRAALTKRMALHLREEKGRYAELITREMGKPIRESLGEIEKCAWLCDYLAENSAALLRPEEVKTEAKRSYIRFDPLGLILAIMPWNFPFWQVFRFGMAAIIAGNCVVLKHAPSVPATSLAIESAFLNAGFPKGVLRSVFVDPPQALALLDENKVDAATLTGSVRAGIEVGKTAGKNIRKAVLELGGSDPYIVLNDADIEKAARTAVSARTINTGQSCIAAKRFIVLRQAADTFQRFFIEYIQKLKIGDPMDKTTDIGPLSRRDILEYLKVQLDDAKQKGARVIQADHQFKKGFFFTPAVVLDPNETMKVLAEEVFGPVAPIIIVDTEEEAVRIANETQYGLGASIWSRDLGRAERLAGQIDSGAIAINDFVRSDPRLPFGGVKRSGIGRELSHYGFKEFVNIKSVVVME